MNEVSSRGVALPATIVPGSAEESMNRFISVYAGTVIYYAGRIISRHTLDIDLAPEE
jgi:hypothetical protein